MPGPGEDNLGPGNKTPLVKKRPQHILDKISEEAHSDNTPNTKVQKIQGHVAEYKKMDMAMKDPEELYLLYHFSLESGLEFRERENKCFFQNQFLYMYTNNLYVHANICIYAMYP